LVMQSAQDWPVQNAPGSLHSARYRRILAQRYVCARLVVVFQVRQQHEPKVPLAKHDDMVNAFPTDLPDQPFRIGI
jgi:hypothetical protein